MTDYTEPQLKQRYRDVMGNELGEVFHHLMQEAAFLHLKWNEYLTLFGTGPERVELLNKAARASFTSSRIHGGMTCFFTSRA